MGVVYGLLVGVPAGFVAAYLLGALILRRRERSLVNRVRLYTSADHFFRTLDGEAKADAWRPW